MGIGLKLEDAYEFTWSEEARDKLTPGVGIVVVFKNADGTPAPQLRVLAMSWRGHAFLIDGRDGRKFMTVLLSQCDPASVVDVTTMQQIARGAAGSVA